MPSFQDFLPDGFFSGSPTKTSADIIKQCQRLDAAGIHYSFFYLVSISGAGRGEIGAKLTADVCNKLHPTLIGANMLAVYPDSGLYAEIQRGDWQEEGELEKYKEVWTLIEKLLPFLDG